MTKGYNSGFISEDIEIPIPRLSERLIGNVLESDRLRESIYLDYLHYTVVMNKSTKQLIFAASNVDQKKYEKTTRGGWDTDSRIPFDMQLNNTHYRKNVFDKGHMVRRATNAWGNSKSEAQQADNATMFYTNSSFQHENFNQDEWLALEDMFKDFREDTNDRLTIFTGTVHADYDRYYTRHWHESVRIPSGFFKVLCFKNKQGNLETRAFVMYQDKEALKDKSGRKRGFNFRTHQVTITELEHLTGLEFDSKLYDANPLYFNELKEEDNNANILTFPERILIEDESDVINSSSDLRGKRLIPEEEQDVRIIAALVDPYGEEEGKEWITLFNVTLKDMYLDNWKLRDRKDRVTNLNGVIKGGSSLRITLTQGVRLSNSGNSITLVDPEGNIVDSQVYSEKQVVEGRTLIF